MTLKTPESWEAELLAQTKKSWGFIATESKQALMLADFEQRKSFINNVITQERQRAVEAMVEALPGVPRHESHADAPTWCATCGMRAYQIAALSALHEKAREIIK